MLCRAVPRCAILRHAALCHAALCHAVLYCTMLHRAVLCHTVPCHTVPRCAIRCHATPCHAVPYCPTPHHVVLCHTVPCRAVPRYARWFGAGELLHCGGCLPAGLCQLSEHRLPVQGRCSLGISAVGMHCVCTEMWEFIQATLLACVFN